MFSILTNSMNKNYLAVAANDANGGDVDVGIAQDIHVCL